MKRLMLCAAAAALMSACSSMPTGEAAMVADAAMEQPAPAAMDFVRMAGASDWMRSKTRSSSIAATRS